MKIDRSTPLCVMTTLVLVMLAGCENEIDCDKPWLMPGETPTQKQAEFLKRCPDQAKAAEALREGTFKKSEPREW